MRIILLIVFLYLRNFQLLKLLIALNIIQIHLSFLTKWRLYLFTIFHFFLKIQPLLFSHYFNLKIILIQQFLNNVTLLFKNKVFAISFKLFLISCANIQLIISILAVLKILTILFLLIIYLFFLAKIISYFGWNIDDVLINFQNIRFFNLKSRTDRITSLFIISASFLVLCGLWWNNNSINFIFLFLITCRWKHALVSRGEG